MHSNTSFSKQINAPWNNNDFNYTNELFSKDASSDAFYGVIAKHLPPVFTRQTASLAIGGLISPKTLSNLDALGKGPSIKVRLGTKVGYERESFILWLKNRML